MAEFARFAVDALAQRVRHRAEAGGVIQLLEDNAKFISEEAKGQARYAFRTLPDLLLSGSLFLTFVLGWQPALASFAAGIITTGLTQGVLSDMIRLQKPLFERAGGLLGGGANKCSGHFPGAAWSRPLLVMGHADELVGGSVPSYYMTVMGYIFGFVSTQEYMFKDELSMRPQTSSWLRVFTITTGLLVAALGIIRYVTDCEPWWSVILSMLLGIILAFIFVSIVVATLGRRQINVLHLPLLEKRIPDEKPIYVCADPNK